MLILTPEGANAVIKFLAGNVANFDSHSKDDWLGHAEAVAMSAQDGEDIVLEVRTIESSTGRPETLKMPRSLFKQL